jgi:HEAT repeat protein
LNDPNSRIQDLALYCQAVNQQLDAIPRIAELERKLLPFENTTGSSAKSLEALQKLQTPKAVPYLNPLLFEPSPYTRINAMMALRDLVDRTSIPYLLLALYDPDDYVAYAAYGLLRHLIPNVAPARDWSLFEVQREAAIRPFLTWWKDELRGKHDKLTIKSHIIEGNISALSVEKLNALILQPSTETRQKAIAELQKGVDVSSIPYLILALHDPNEDVAYSAYRMLYRLRPKLKGIKERAAFNADRKTALLPIYDWWEDELLGRHVPKPESVKQEGAAKAVNAAT